MIDTASITIDLLSKKKIASKDVKKFDIKRAIRYHAEQFDKLEGKVIRAGDNISEIVNIINNHFNETLLVLLNEQLSLDVDRIGSVIELNSMKFLRKELKEDLFVQFYIINNVHNHLKKALGDIKPSVQKMSVSVPDIMLRFNQNKKLRACNLNIFQIFVQLARLQLGQIFVPFQTIVIETFTNITNFIMSFYISPSESNSSILASLSECTNTFVSNVVTEITSIKTIVNTVFNYVIYGTSKGIDSSDTSSSDD